MRYARLFSQWFLPMASGALLALSLDVPTLWPLAFIGLLPLLIFIQRTSSYAKAFLGGWFAGSVLVGGALIWFWDTLPLDWFGVSDFLVGIGYVLISWGVLSLTLALSVGAWAVTVRWFLMSGFLSSWLVVPALWVFFEYVRAWIFVLVTYGEGTSLGANFTLGYVGYILANHLPLLQFASIGKVYLLSFIVVLINFLLWWVFARARISLVGRFTCCFVVLVLLVGSSYVTAPILQGKDGKEISVATLHTNFPASLIVTEETQARKEADLLQLVREVMASGERPDIIVLPEDTRFLSSLISRNKLEDFAKEMFGDRPVLLVDSGRVADKGVVKQRLFYYQTKEKVLKTREKAFLLPQGEYVPKLFTLIVGLFGKSTKQVEASRTYAPGATYAIGGVDIRVGGLFCAELLSPSIHARIAEQNPDILVNVSSQSWFHGSRTVYYQTQLIAKVRAVETGLPLIVAANVSPAFVVNSRGSIIAESGWDNSEVLRAEIRI